MTHDEIVIRVQRIATKMSDYEWKAAQRLTGYLLKELQETPADIIWDEERINMIGRNGNTGEHYDNSNDG